LHELRRYLDVHDKFYKKGLTIEEIANQMVADIRMTPEVKKRICRRDLKKAEKIIDNVEHGYFPGKY
jgi:hypothetical protein